MHFSGFYILLIHWGQAFSFLAYTASHWTNQDQPRRVDK